MKNNTILLLSLLGFFACQTAKETKTGTLESPGKTVGVEVNLTEAGQPFYKVSFNGNEVVGKSLLGLDIQGQNFKDGFKIVDQSSRTYDGTWKPITGGELGYTWLEVQGQELRPSPKKSYYEYSNLYATKDVEELKRRLSVA